MKDLAKKIVRTFPFSLRRQAVALYEQRGRNQIEIIPHFTPGKHIKKNILFYHLSGLSFGGTEKFLQILAKYLDKEKYNVFFMYSPKPRNASNPVPLDGRLSYLENCGVTLINFDYDSLDQRYPYIVRTMKPSVFNIIKEKNIDLFVSAGSGYAEFPFNIIPGIPILLINIFGSPTAQKNIIKNICISHEVAGKIKPFVKKETMEVMYILSEQPPDNGAMLGKELRSRLGLKDTDVVFGRIGRADDGIFDPIGLTAFKEVVKNYPDAHYLIMSPPPIAEKMVADENIKNVHFLPPSAREDDIWAFHFAIDALAHFRRDGESCGLNILESMLAAKPVISHRSKQWNAHTEYLDRDFSRIAEIDNSDQYKTFMEEFAGLKKQGILGEMGRKAKVKAETLVSTDKNIPCFESWIEQAI